MSTPIPRLKWHQLRRRSDDPVFLRENLAAGLRAGAALEVDVVLTADGHAVCLHDLSLDNETTGTGPVAEASRAEIERLQQRGYNGKPLPSPPLFFDEVVDAARRLGPAAPGIIQLDIKEPPGRLVGYSLDRLIATLDDLVPAFTVGGHDWETIERLVEAAPGLRAGFDPQGLYGERMPTDAAAFRSLATETLTQAPTAAIYYLEADLVMAGLVEGVNLIELVSAKGAEVDAWTIDLDRASLLPRLIAAGCHQITTNDPLALAPIVAEIVA